MQIARTVKLRSPDTKIQVGSVLVSNKNNRILSTGYNSIPAGLDDSIIDWSDREYIRTIVIHSEVNCILYSESKFEETTLFTTLSPCIECLKMIRAANIKKVVYQEEYRDLSQVKELAKFFEIELIQYPNTII